MIVDGFVRKQLPPAPPEIAAQQPTVDEGEAATKVVETYLNFGVMLVAHLFKGGQGMYTAAPRKMVGKVH